MVLVGSPAVSKSLSFGLVRSESQYDVTVGHTLVHAHAHHQQTNSKKRTARAATIGDNNNVMPERSFCRLKEKNKTNKNENKKIRGSAGHFTPPN